MEKKQEMGRKQEVKRKQDVEKKHSIKNGKEKDHHRPLLADGSERLERPQQRAPTEKKDKAGADADRPVVLER